MDKKDYYLMPSSAASILREKKVLLILPPSDFNDKEFDYLYHYLKKARLSITITSLKATAVSSAGVSITTQIKPADVEVEDFDAIVILGDASGSCVEQFCEDQDIVRIIKKADAKKRIIAASGMAPRALASAGILKGKMLTSWRDPSLVSSIERAGGTYQWEPVVSDGTLITADSPSSVSTLADMLIDALTR